MKYHIAVLLLFSSIASGPMLFAQQRSGGPAPAAAAPALTPAQQEETLRQAVDLLQRMRSTPNMPESDRVNMLRELERALAQLQRAQENAPRAAAAGARAVQGLPVIASVPFPVDSAGGGPLAANRAVRIDGVTTAWWTNTNLMARLGLTDDQKARIERTFESNKQDLTANRDQLEKEEAELSKLLAADSLDRGKITAQINRVIQARGEMERVNSLMVLEMRGVLTSPQWSQLQLQNSSAVNASTPFSASPAAAPGFGIRGGGGLGGGSRGPAPATPKQ